MTKAPPSLLNDDVTASMATALMMSHHDFARDTALFAEALRRVAEAIGQAWQLAREWRASARSSTGTTRPEDTGIFPHMRGEHPELAATIDASPPTPAHRSHPRGRRARLRRAARDESRGGSGRRNCRSCSTVTWHRRSRGGSRFFLRAAKQSRSPANETELGFFAQGFAWASHGSPRRPSSNCTRCLLC